MAQAWPVTVTTVVLEDGYREQRPDNALRTPMDAGPFKARRISGFAGQVLTFSQNITAAEKSTLETFFDSTLKYGALDFTRTHPGTGSSVTMVYISPPAFVPATPGRWIVTHSVMVTG